MFYSKGVSGSARRDSEPRV